MADNTENYVSDIHDQAYEARFLAKKLDARCLVNADSRQRETLNGQWSFGIDWYDTCKRAAWYREELHDEAGRLKPVDWEWDALEQTPVPSCWNLRNPELRYFEGSGIYTRTFRVEIPKAGERVFIRFEGAQYRTVVFLNGHFIGYHDGGSTPFSAELGPFLQVENRLIVVVETRLKKDRVPPDNTDWFNYGGLYRDVYLFRVPSAFIKDWFVRLVPDGDFSAIDIDITTGGGAEDDLSSAWFATLSLPELGLEERIPIRNGKGKKRFSAKPDLWSPANPKLYELRLDLFREGEAPTAEAPTRQMLDRVTDRIGFRELRVAGRDILLNGQPIFLKGICVHEDHIELGKTTTEAVIRETIRHLKELNGNYLRLAHYPHDPRFAKIADEEGLLLWEEVPVYWAMDFANAAVYADAENQLAELILRDRNRASVAIWSVGNENADTEERLRFMSKLAAKARELDGSRPVSAACLINTTRLAIEDRLVDALDIIGINEYYGWYDPDFSKLPQILENSRPDKPVVICEFGGGARAGFRGKSDEFFTEDMQAGLYRRQIDVIRDCAYIKGMTPWILYDFRCPRRINRYQAGFNRKGLIDADRSSKKLAFMVLAAFYADLK